MSLKIAFFKNRGSEIFFELAQVCMRVSMYEYTNMQKIVATMEGGRPLVCGICLLLSDKKARAVQWSS